MIEKDKNKVSDQNPSDSVSGDKSDKSVWTYKDWYEKNKEALSQRRKNRYHGDERYKKRVLDKNKLYRAIQSAKKNAGKASSGKVRIPKHRKPVVMSISINGENQEASMVHIGAFARAIGRSVPTVYQWERLGLMPRTPYSLDSKNKQERLYTSSMIEVVRAALSTRGRYIASSDTNFYREIKEGWAAIGVIAQE